MDVVHWDNCKIGLFIDNRNVLFPILLIPRTICGQVILFNVEKNPICMCTCIWGNVYRH